jgi:hypothetical protein
MQVDDEQRWREAMQKMGKPAVEAELQRRPGSPDDLIYDIVYSPPFPTREFCWQWCIETDNTLFRFSKHSVMVLSAVIVLLIAVVQMVGSLSATLSPPSKMMANQTKSQSNQSGTQASAAGSSSSSSSTDPSASPSIPSSSYVSSSGASSTSSGSSSGSSASSGRTGPLTCAYISYATTRCPQTTQ